METNRSFKITLILITVFAIISISFKIEPIAKAYEEFLPNVVYQVNYQFYSKGKDKKLFVKSYVPQNNERQKISRVKQEAKSMNSVIKNEEDNKRIIWREEEKSRLHTINYSFLYQGKAIKYIINDDLPLKNLSNTVDKKYLQDEEYIEVSDENILFLANSLSYNAKDLKKLIKRFFDYIHRIPTAPIRDLTSAPKAFGQDKVSANGKTRLFVALCRSKGIPARLKGGLILEETKKRTSHLWAVVYVGNKWVPDKGISYDRGSTTDCDQ